MSICRHCADVQYCNVITVLFFTSEINRAYVTITTDAFYIYIDIYILCEILQFNIINAIFVKYSNHYRATLCVRAVFAVARCPSVRQSVCPSVTLVDCIQTAEDIVKLLDSGAPSF